MDLFLEEIFEGLAGVERTGRRDFRSDGSLGGLLVGSGSRVLLDGHAKFVKLAGVLAVFGGDALGNGLHALELCSGIEITALFAAVQFGVALGTGPVGIEAGCEDGATVRTASA